MVLSIKYATFKWLSILKTFPGVAPLSSIAADSRTFPAGVLLIRGWLVNFFDIHNGNNVGQSIGHPIEAKRSWSLQGTKAATYQ